ncbi:MAG: hypothetical protein LC774_01710, partial [Acidobacteria bacterium]|nr:hypothetical protein [Acidobacteriota bacterium]
GWTSVWDAIWVTANEVTAQTSGQTRRAIILLSDGDDTLRRGLSVHAASARLLLSRRLPVRGRPSRARARSEAAGREQRRGEQREEELRDESFPDPHPFETSPPARFDARAADMVWKFSTPMVVDFRGKRKGAG